MNVTYSNRAAARLAGVSHVAIAKAKQRGHLHADAAGKISSSDLQRWMAQRAARRVETCPFCGCMFPQTKSTPPAAKSFGASQSVVARIIARATAAAASGAAAAFIHTSHTELSS